MRIIAGKFRSRHLKPPPRGLELRPTSDRLRETLFNVLANQIEGAVFVDLFAGTGGVGIEALSRGAAKVYLAESDRKAARLIRENLQALTIGEEAELFECDATQAIHSLEAETASCDIIFLDPPYDAHGAYARTLELLADSSMVTGETLVIAEHDKHFDPGAATGTLQRYRQLRQGDAVLSFYRRGG